RSDFRLEVASRETGRVGLATQVRAQKSRLGSGKRYTELKRPTENSENANLHGILMVKRTRLPTIVMGRSMSADASTAKDPKVTFELEAETGEVFEVSFSLLGILTTVVMAHGWSTLKEELAQLEPPTKV